MPSNKPKSKAATKPRLQRRESAAIVDSGLPTAKEVAADRAAMGIFLRQTRDFRLAFALHNDPAGRDAFLRQLSTELASDDIHLLILDLITPSQEHTLLGRVQETVAQAPKDQRYVLMVINLEAKADYTPELTPASAPANTWISNANFHRDLFPAACPAPLVIWMTELLERALAFQAPDLTRWRSHLFDLRTRAKPGPSPLELNGQRLPSHDQRLHPEQRLQRLEEELAAYRKIGSRVDELRTLSNIGLARLDLGDARLAKLDFEEVLSIARRIGDRAVEGAALANLGLTSIELADSRKAVEYLDQALAAIREGGNRRNEGSILGSLGIAHDQLGDSHKAIELYEKWLSIARDTADPRGEAQALGSLGSAYATLGDVRKAIDYHEKCLLLNREAGDRPSECKTLGNLGNAYSFLGETLKAIDFYQQSLIIARDYGDQRSEAAILWNSARRFYQLGDRNEAMQCARAALAIMDATGIPHATMVRKTLAKWQAEAPSQP